MTRARAKAGRKPAKRGKKRNKKTTSVTPRKVKWSDEFDGAAGTPPDSKNWVYDIGGGGYGNNESQTYTDRPVNACHDGKGNLVITAQRETFTGPDGITKDYTSARIKTQGKVSFRYGRVAARIKGPSGKGIWPAFWMLGTDIASIGWAKCGEVDIYEKRGSKPTVNLGSLHGHDYAGAGALTEPFNMPDDDDFHVYAVEWEAGKVRFYVDDVLYSTRTPADIPGKTWAFDHDFFIILNLAVGGNFDGEPDATTVFPQKLLVDYVRVYE